MKNPAAKFAMGVANFFSNEEETKPKVDARFGGRTSMFYDYMWGNYAYTGEKNSGELGPIKVYMPDYAALRARSWQMMLDSDVAQIVIGKYINWVIGKGLKLQVEPSGIVLKDEGINLNTKTFSEMVEARFGLYAQSKRADHARQKTLNKLQAVAFKNALVGGDCVVVIRLEGENEDPNIEIKDGSHITDPLQGNEWFALAKANGNRIENGIELSQRNEHIAYYVRKQDSLFEVERISCRGEQTGLQQAFMIYGSEYRIDNHRGMPLLSILFETAKKLDRYKEATVGSAEERAKIVLAIQHEIASDGANPFTQATAQARDIDLWESQAVPFDEDGNALAKTVAATTNKQVVNMTQGAKLETLDKGNELYFKDFFSVLIDLFCATVQMPPEVAMSKYNSNYSASRASLKDWENTLGVKRHDFGTDFMQPIWTYWFHVNVMKNVLSAPGYLVAFYKKQYWILEAYLRARFSGAAIPHIDPVKEVEAERAKLGVTGAAIPLTTVEAATEALGGGDSDANLEQYSEELKNSISKGVKIPEPPAKPASGS